VRQEPSRHGPAAHAPGHLTSKRSSTHTLCHSAKPTGPSTCGHQAGPRITSQHIPRRRASRAGG
jgi:hypothetical protein